MGIRANKKNQVGTLWLKKDEHDNSYLKGYFYVVARGHNICYPVLCIKNKDKIRNIDPDYIIHDMTREIKKRGENNNGS